MSFLVVCFIKKGSTKSCLREKARKFSSQPLFWMSFLTASNDPNNGYEEVFFLLKCESTR